MADAIKSSSPDPVKRTRADASAIAVIAIPLELLWTVCLGFVVTLQRQRHQLGQNI